MFPQNELAETILLSTYGRKNLFKKRFPTTQRCLR